MHAEEVINNQEKAASDNYDKLLEAKYNIGANTLIVAALLKESRDNGYWKILKHDSFEDFLGSPELGFRRSKAYALIQLYELYVDKLKVPADRILSIGTSKLAKIAPIVESDVEGWLSKAEHLSKSDLIIELGQGPGVTKISPPPLASAPLTRMTPDQYLELVKSSPCLNCGATDTVVPAHFPRTRVRCEHPWHVVPLCYKCHLEQEGSSKWCWDYRGNWAKWFYSLIVGEQNGTW